MQLTQLSDKVGILAVLVSYSLVFKCGVFRITAFWRSYTFCATRRATNPPFYFFARAFIFSARAVVIDRDGVFTIGRMVHGPKIFRRGFRTLVL